jgi:hypothetical protein
MLNQTLPFLKLMKSQINDIFFLLALLYFAANLKAASLLCQVFLSPWVELGSHHNKGVAAPAATPILKLKHLLANVH